MHKFAVFSGFLGSGKTTTMIALTKYHTTHHGKAAMISNDLGGKGLADNRSRMSASATSTNSWPTVSRLTMPMDMNSLYQTSPVSASEHWIMCITVSVKNIPVSSILPLLLFWWSLKQSRICEAGKAAIWIIY